MRRIVNRKRGRAPLLILAVTAVLLLMVALPAAAQESQPEDAPLEADKSNCISGYAWFDGNHSGTWEENEDAMDGARVDLFAVGPFDLRPGNLWRAASLLTRDGGYYEFCRLSPGSYYVQLTPPEGVLRDNLLMTYGSNPTAVIPFAQDDSLTITFGMAAPRTWASPAVLQIPRR